MLLRTAIRPSSTPFFTRCFSRGRSPVFVAFGLALPFIQPGPITRFDTSPSPSNGGYSHATAPITTDGKTLNPAAVRQISLGSILGLGAGLLVSAFSTSLTLLLGLGIVVWQYAARKGYNLIPIDRLQRYITSVDLRSAINDNVAFKISFGLMFVLAAFCEF